MKSSELVELNFRKLLHYGDAPDVRASKSSPTPCTGFCISCERNGFLDGWDLRLDQMSHGADTEDFEKAICKLPTGGLAISVAFLLESPGKYWGNGNSIEYEGRTKQPPVNHYYWVPRLAEWPSEPVKPKSYGPYFAYLIAKHKLHRAYFTNVVKCSLAKCDADQFIGYYVTNDADNRHSKIRANCYKLFLSEEMKIVNPKIVFFFGQKAARMGLNSGLGFLLPDTHFVTLEHPAARKRQIDIVSRNDERISAALSKWTEACLPQ